MAIGIALAAEEHEKIVSTRHLCNAVKSYLPTHGTFHKIAHCALCIFADAIRKECAEAKRGYERFVFSVFRTLRIFSDESRMLRQMFSARIILFLNRMISSFYSAVSRQTAWAAVRDVLTSFFSGSGRNPAA